MFTTVLPHFRVDVIVPELLEFPDQARAIGPNRADGAVKHHESLGALGVQLSCTLSAESDALVTLFWRLVVGRVWPKPRTRA